AESHHGDARSLRESSEIQLDFIDIAPAPAFAGFDGLHDRVLRGVEVLRRMLVLRGVAAAHIAAGQAESQMNPSVAQFEAFGASGALRLHVSNLAHMGAFFHRLGLWLAAFVLLKRSLQL